MKLHALRAARETAGWTLIHTLIAIVVAALLIILVSYCTARGRGGITITSSISKEVEKIAAPILAGAKTQDIREAADKLAREVIKNSLEAGMSKEDIRQWCQEIRQKLNEAKAGLPNDEKLKYDAAQRAIDAACQELVGH